MPGVLKGRSVADRKTLFESWAQTYDADVDETAGFPFAGYDAVLAWVVRGSGVETGQRVLDVGTGTGALAARFAALGAHVLGVDFSEAMLVRARNNVLDAQFAPLELLEPWDALTGWHFDAVVSSYVLHEFDMPIKLQLIERMTDVLKPGGSIILGDISFETAAALAAARSQWADVWDESEFYWEADAAIRALKDAGFSVQYRQVSFCGGIYTLSLAR